MILGLTGGMGSGKSTVADVFEELGYRRIDSDAVVRERLLEQAEVVAAVGDYFGRSALGPEGRIDRRKVAERVFADDGARLWLEALLHPRLFAYWRQELAASPDANWVFEVPLLFEKGLENWFDFTLCVSTTVENQFARLEKRGISRAQAEPRISKQLPLARKIELADFVISNDGTVGFLRRQVFHLVRMFSGQR